MLDKVLGGEEVVHRLRFHRIHCLRIFCRLQRYESQGCSMLAVVVHVTRTWVVEWLVQSRELSEGIGCVLQSLHCN
jgi:hypothetical protein